MKASVKSVKENLPKSAVLNEKINPNYVVQYKLINSCKLQSEVQRITCEVLLCFCFID